MGETKKAEKEGAVRFFWFRLSEGRCSLLQPVTMKKSPGCFFCQPASFPARFAGVAGRGIPAGTEVRIEKTKVLTVFSKVRIVFSKVLTVFGRCFFSVPLAFRLIVFEKECVRESEAGKYGWAEVSVAADGFSQHFPLPAREPPVPFRSFKGGNGRDMAATAIFCCFHGWLSK